MLAEVYTRLIKGITGSGSTKLKIFPSPNKRVFSIQIQATYAGGTNTLAALMTAITEIRMKVGTVVKCRLNGTKLRDWMLLHGTQYDYNGLPNTGAQITIPFAPEWLMAYVADGLAWNPAVLGGEICVEIDSSTALTVTALEEVADNLDAQSLGIITYDVITPVAGGVSFYTKEEIELKGRLLCASIYPDSTNSNEITPASLLLGKDDVMAYEAVTSAQNDEKLERWGLTPAATGRTANIFDMAFVKNDMLSRGIDLSAWSRARLKIEAAAAMAGTCDILLVRLEPK